MAAIIIPAKAKLTKNFALAEYACRCGCRWHMRPEIRAQVERHAATIMQPLRDDVGVALHITSGCRCPKWNDYVGGAPESYHKKGMAADFIPAAASLVAVHQRVLRIPAVGGCHLYGTFIHADTRPRINGRIMDWEG